MTERERARFWSKVIEGEPSSHAPQLGPCLLWTAAVDGNGYGVFQREDRGGLVRAHRFAWQDEKGPVPERTLDHLCRVRRCVRVDHLEPVPYGENTRRGWALRRPLLCKRGHSLEDAYVTPSGSRDCRLCRRERRRAYRARRGAQ